MKYITLVLLLFASSTINTNYAQVGKKPENTIRFFPSLPVFSDNWYSRHLKVMNEPALWQNTKGDVIRFLWLRTFDNPVSVKIEKRGNKIILSWIITGGKGGYEPEKIITNKSKSLSLQQWNDCIALLNNAGYWDMSTIKEEKYEVIDIVLDGDQWILEANINKKYHIVDRPDGDSIRNLCLYFLNLTDIFIHKEKIY